MIENNNLKVKRKLMKDQVCLTLKVKEFDLELD